MFVVYDGRESSAHITRKGFDYMKLDAQSREMLDLLLSSEPDGPRKSFSYHRICEISNLEEDDMFPVIKWLVSCGFAEYAYRTGNSGRKDVGISLTQSGLKYKEYVDMSRKERWIERAVGFVFGVASSFLAALIGWLLR